MCISIKALLRDIEDSFNTGYLVLEPRQRILINDYCWTKTLKIAVTTILTHVCRICYSCTPTGLNKVRLINTKWKWYA